MSQAIVRQELESRLVTWAATQTPVVKLAIENTPFVKPTDYTTFIENFIVPSFTQDVTVDGTRRRYLGILQLNIWTKDGEGSGKTERIIDSLVSTFKVVPKTGVVSIEKTPSASRAITTEGWRITPFTINYRYES